jgi:Fur family zinc uptake transcriptional regulator
MTVKSDYDMYDKDSDDTCNAHGETSFNRNETLVFETLKTANQPLSAYNILDRLRDKGVRAPTQIYRALESLLAAGQVHRLESLNAFIPCNHSHCQAHEQAAFAICEACGKVTEFSNPNIEEGLARWGGEADFQISHTTIELRGLCRDCANPAS